MDREIIYVADPMCSWCWGFAPVIAAIGHRVAGRVPLSLVVGGLRPGTTEAMDDDAKHYVRGHWEHVGKETGQPFDFAFFERHGFVYDTEPACRAAVTVRALKTERGFDYFESLHRAFYVDNRDVTAPATLAKLAEAQAIERADFEAAFDSPEMRHQTSNDFMRSRALGIQGFPAVVVRDGDKHAYLTVGYRPYEALAPALESWLEG